MTVPTPYKGNESYIFVSYAHKDDAAVWEIVENMQAAGFRVWFDRGIDPGTEWDEYIARKVQGCGYFIAFLSPNYLASSNCKDELNFARDLDKNRLLVYLEEVELPPGMAMRLNRLQAIFRNRYEDETQFYEKLFSAKGIGSHRTARLKEASVPRVAVVSAVPHYDGGGGQRGGRQKKRRERLYRSRGILPFRRGAEKRGRAVSSWLVL